MRIPTSNVVLFYRKFLSTTCRDGGAGWSCRRYCSSASIPSRTGFDDYEETRRTFSVKFPEKFNFTVDVIDKWAKKEEEKGRKNPAFWYMYESGKQLKWSFRELSQKTKKTARLLNDFCGLQRDENIMVILPKVPEFWLVNLAAIRAGIVLSPGSMMLTAKDVKYRVDAFKPKCVIAYDSVVDVVEEGIGSSSSVESKVVVSSSYRQRKGWLDFNELFEKSSSDHQAADTSSDDAMMVFFTSGTTGLPKMVEHSHASYGISLGFAGRFYFDLSEETMMWSFSDTGWAKTAYGNIFGPWNQGSCVFIHQMPRFSSEVVLKVLSEIPIDTICAAPTMYRMLVQEDLSKFKPLKLSHCLGGGEPMSAEVINAWKKATNLKIYEGYGQTETSGTIGMYKCVPHKPGSMGKAQPGVDIAILDENYKELGPNKQGQIAIKRSSAQAAGFFKQYRNDPEKTASRFVGDYYLTGDMAYYDDDGYFWFMSRVDDVITSAGYRIGPYEVESALMEHPAVVEVGVTSSPDKLRGEVVTAYVVLQKKRKDADKESLTKELQEHVKKVTAPYKYPRKIRFVDELPKTVSGKIRRAELKRWEWEGQNK